ncbi:hypothetical protein GGH94_002896 [Coemansia aciculifera]|uniref:Metallo-beta-lactamase domain-containing protein n=1 Tax=Coemansia aciculifera TaxID=417176 RepID=A0A9W8II22_9FUNG|nr:hypothetical protein GGH94_002896 [Coemansia aciculifera]KAJ2874003.1 hypothetical protein GGH93_002748 [Coemansia aciculifera]
MVPAEATPTTAVSRVREVIFLGSGTSACIPVVPCITSNYEKCKACKISLTPEGSKNRRRNTSLLVRIDHADGRERNIVIDCGKTFLESATEVFVKHDVKSIDAVLLTHGHADAMFGLDDLRQWTSSFGVRRFRPQRAIFTDISHHMVHSELELQAKNILVEEGLVADPAFDGMVVTLV